jgi:hypothetical protein
MCVRPFVGLAKNNIRKGEELCLNTQTTGHWPTQTIKQSSVLYGIVINPDMEFLSSVRSIRAMIIAWGMRE